jgi:hypothetical protein
LVGPRLSEKIASAIGSSRTRIERDFDDLKRAPDGFRQSRGLGEIRRDMHEPDLTVASRFGAREGVIEHSVAEIAARIIRDRS